MLGLGARFGGLGVGLFEGEFGFGELGLGVLVLALRGLGVGDALGDLGEAGLAGGFADGEGGLDLRRGLLGGGDVGLQAFAGDVFAERFLGILLELGLIGSGDTGLAGFRGLREVHLHRRGEAELDAFAGGDEARLQLGDFGEVAALADLQLVVLGAVELDRGRRTADGFTVQANRGGGRIGGHDDRIDVGRIDRGIATGDRGAQDEKGDGDTHGYGAWGGSIPSKNKSVSTPNRLISLRVDTGRL